MLSSISSYLNLLQEGDHKLVELGLQKILKNVDNLWAQIADKLLEIEKLAEDKQKPYNELASFIVSKVYYNLEEYQESLYYGLESGQYFDSNRSDKYTETLVNNSIQRFISFSREEYIRSSQIDIEVVQSSNLFDNQKQTHLDKQIKQLVQNMLNQSLLEKQFKVVVGVGLESMRIDILDQIMEQAQQTNESTFSDTLDYTFKICNKYVQIQKFRVECLSLIEKYYKQKTLKNFEYLNLSQCLFQLNNVKGVGQMLTELLDKNEQQYTLLAFQISQDLADNESQQFARDLIKELGDSENKVENIIKLKRILDGTFGEDLNIQFIKQMNKSIPETILGLKQSVENKNSVQHNNVIICNSILQTGTTSDSFMREHFDWCSKATHWNKFQLVSSLGSIHKGNHLKSFDLLKPYFVGNTGQPNWYAHGGSLYALGLIHSNTKDQQIIKYLQEQITNNINNEQLVHGGCLGLGLVAIGSQDMQIYEQLLNILNSNNALTGEAAGLAIGLIMANTNNNEIIQELLNFANETEHEKIIRSIVLGISMMLFKQEQNSEQIIKQMISNKDPIIRYGGMFCIGMSYIGSNNSQSIKQLLYYASHDHVDDVKRAAIINIGFIMQNNLTQLPKILNLLLNSYNPHVRYGAILALAIGSAAKPNPTIINMIQPLLKDPSDIVRQGAYMGLSMILQQINPSVNDKREQLDISIQEIIKKVHVDNMTKQGALFGKAILQAGGQNQLIQLYSRNGEIKMRANLGMMVFLNSWYWFPFNHFFSLTLAPSAFLGVTQEFKVPEFNIFSNCKKELFQYQIHEKTTKNTQLGQLDTVKLSMADKAKARVQNKKDNKKEDNKKEDNKESEMEVESNDNNQIEQKNQLLTNPCRVLPKQEDYIQIQSDRYTPIIDNRKRGIIFMMDNQLGQDDQLFCSVNFIKPIEESRPVQLQVDQIQPPEDFIFDEQKQAEYRNSL